MQIPSWPQAGEREAELLRMVLESPQWGGFHPFVTEFEQSFATYQHAAFGISAFNGTVTLELALTLLGIGPGDEVIVPAISFISTATAVARVGAVPVFVDIEEYSFNIDPERVREAISSRTKALLAVHFGGAMCNVDELEAICRQHSLFFIEDAAHAHGSEWNNRRAGSFGIAGSFSFQNGKVLCSGEGGMLVTSDESFAERARSVANCGRIAGRSFYEHHRLGTNFRLTAFQAAVLLAQFEDLNEQIDTRTANAQFLKSELSDRKEIVWQYKPEAITRNSHYLLLGRLLPGAAVTRDEFHARLGIAGVPCTPFYPHTLYQNPVFQEVACRVMPCPVAEACVRDAFWFPHRMLLADEETISEIAKAIRSAVSKQGSESRLSAPPAVSLR
ncbi:MAG: DegT/DnrJ/EryC1/StrS family aminotransferase [Acidobacteriaceae bacterium]|nr:DegT/DnrJ/EryC1/StrS family aminotransferase [Acidobacteriaceae bacterium]